MMRVHGTQSARFGAREALQPIGPGRYRVENSLDDVVAGGFIIMLPVEPLDARVQ
jgi:hypothetical protein